MNGEHSYEFVCNCLICTSPHLEDALTRSIELDDSILRLASIGKVDTAIRKGEALINIYDKLNMSSWLYYRTYYDLFQSAITKRNHLADRIKYIQHAYNEVLAYTSDKDAAETRKMKCLLLMHRKDIVIIFFSIDFSQVFRYSLEAEGSLLSSLYHSVLLSRNVVTYSPKKPSIHVLYLLLLRH